MFKVLKRAGCLGVGHNLETFLFKDYNFNSIENLSLVALWNYSYKLKFNTEKYAEIKLSSYLKQIIRQLALLTPNLKFELKLFLTC